MRRPKRVFYWLMTVVLALQAFVFAVAARWVPDVTWWTRGAWALCVVADCAGALTIGTVLLSSRPRRPRRPLPVRRHTYRQHLYVPGVCTCGWPPDDERHCSCDPGSYMGLHGLTCPLRRPDSEGLPAAEQRG